MVIKKLHQSRNKVKFLILGVILLSFFLRFYKIHGWLMFGMDQEYEAFLVKNILSGNHFPLIGVNASDTGLYLGPLFIYFASIPFAISRGNPLGWAITASLIGVITTYLVFKIGKGIFSEKIGLLGAFFYGASILTVFYDRQFWNPTLVPFFSLILGYLILQIWKGNFRKTILLGLIFGLAIQSHLSLLIFLPIIAYVLWKERRKITKRIAIYSLLSFFITQIPIILFDLRHSFTNLRAFIQLLTHVGINTAYTSNLADRLYLFFSMIGRFFLPGVYADWFIESGQCKELLLYQKSGLMVGIGLVVLAVGLIFTMRRTIFDKIQSQPIKLLTFIFLSAFLFVVIYNRQIFEYYFLFLFPWLALMAAYLIYVSWQKFQTKKIIYLFLLTFLFINILSFFTSKHNYSYQDKISTFNFVRQILGKKTYSLESVGECPRFGGYRYLSEYFVSTPSSSYMDSYLSWLYPKSVSNSKPRDIVLLSLIDSRSPKNIISKWEEDKLRIISLFDAGPIARFGDIQVYILKSKDNVQK